MLDQLFSGLMAGDTKTQLTKQGLNSNQLDDVMKIAGNVMTKEVGKQITGGNQNTLMNLFSNQTNNSSSNVLESAISNGIATQLQEKLGLNKAIAGTAVSIILPKLLGSITKANDETPEDDFSPLSKIFGGGGENNQDDGVVGGLINKLF